MLDSQKFYINISRNIIIYIDEYCFTIKLYCTGPAIGQPQHLLPQPLTDLHYLTAILANCGGSGPRLLIGTE